MPVIKENQDCQQAETMSPSNQVSITLCLLTSTEIFSVGSFILESNALSKTVRESSYFNRLWFPVKHLAINFINVLDLIYFE